MDATAPAGLEALRCAVGTVLEELGTNAQRITEKDQWWFLAGKGDDTTTWFCTVHARLYPANHSRHWPLDRAVITLVPAWIFSRVLPTGASPDTRREVRSAFEQQGMHYAVDAGAVAGTKI